MIHCPRKDLRRINDGIRQDPSTMKFMLEEKKIHSFVSTHLKY